MTRFMTNLDDGLLNVEKFAFNDIYIYLVVFAVYLHDNYMMTQRNYIWLNQLSNTTNLWWVDVYYIFINYMFRRL